MGSFPAAPDLSGGGGVGLINADDRSSIEPTAAEPGTVRFDPSSFVRLDELERAMMHQPAAECPLVHRFTKGLYVREIHMPAGALVTSKIHRTQHPFTISKGRVSVWIDGVWQELAAPHTGITEPGTKRVLYVHEDTVWTTYHPTDETDIDKIEAAIIEPRYEHLEGLVQPTAEPVPALTAGGEP